MKINVEIECTPEEARTFMGLPDVSQANSVYVDNIAKAMKGVSSPDQLQEYAERLAPMGQMGMKLFQSFVEGGMRTASGSGSPSSSSRKSKTDSEPDE
ncbi:DUF6489 family protein [Erythrobacter sp. YT30]|uniref:DUF6489 family protein n=1 Tax=Erythrobacter sp. YT30 TaxID=1735012 RepID=UPI00076CA6CD|nr:DUF6489 family protein [Erythrobacter sp. YT30]KWV91409.1 hypothetical protein AUC45_09090 [Erythrobacter sp. YT30]